MKKEIDKYNIQVDKVVTEVVISIDEGDFVPTYSISVLNISKATAIILEKIRERFVSEVTLQGIKIGGYEGMEKIKEKFSQEVSALIKKYFPNISEENSDLLVSYVIQQDLGLGDLETLIHDSMLEEIVVNRSNEPVWVFHKKHGWLKTNIFVPNEGRIRHYATMIAKEVGKEITMLNPLLDAHLKTGDRVNATLKPISAFGNTITIRKFAARPWTVTDFIKANTLSTSSAAFMWLAVQNELSTLISGGTASGKTSLLNVIANFFPPNQRVISIEDTRELQLPDSLHWVPMETRLPNPEGKGGVAMLDLIVNSLRMRPDRIIVGEIRRKEEAEVLFEAMHTGHSVYGTLHANNAHETIIRLTNPPINIPKLMLPALSLIVTMNRNRRTGKRRVLQIAEVTPTGDAKVLSQLDVSKDELKKVHESETVMNTLNLYTGMSEAEIKNDLKEKEEIIKWIVKENIIDVNKIGLLMAKYYTQGKIKR